MSRSLTNNTTTGQVGSILGSFTGVLEGAVDAANATSTALGTTTTYLSDQITTETARAMFQEAELAASVEALVSGASAGTAALSASIDAEVTRATAAEAVLTSNLAAEVSRAVAAEAGYATKQSVDDEIYRAIGAESILSSNVTAEVMRATIAETTLTTNLAAEVSRATAAEGVLATNLATEVSRATAAEGVLTTNLAAEVSRAIAAEEFALTVASSAETVAYNADAVANSTYDALVSATQPLRDATSSAVVSTLMLRSPDNTTSVLNLKTDTIESLGSALTMANAAGTSTVNIGTGSGVQVLNVGTGSGVTTINIGGAGDTVNISGALNNVTTTNTQVQDKSLVLNSGNGAGTAGGSGIYFEEAGVNTANFIRVNATRDGFEMKAPSSSLIELNQSLLTTSNPTFGTVNAALNGTATTCTTIPALSGEVSSVGNVVTLANSAVIGKQLTGFTSSSGVISSADTVKTAIEKLNGNIGASSGGTTYMGDWNVGTAYAASNIVTYGLNLYQAQSANTGSEPEVDSAVSIQLLTDAQVPNAFQNSAAQELGFSFTSSAAGYISAIRFYKYATTTGTSRNVSLWNQVTGGLIARGTSVGESTAAGWITVALPTPVLISPGTVYLATRSHLGGAHSTELNFANANQSNGLTITNGWSGAAPPVSSTTLNFYTDVVFRAAAGNPNWKLVVSGHLANEREMIAAAYNATLLATRLNTGGAIVRRDPSGGFVAGTITAALTGTATTCTTIPNLTGEVTSVGNATTVTNAAVIGKVLTGFTGTAGTVAATDSLLSFANKTAGNLGVPTNTNVGSQIVKRDASGGFSAGAISCGALNASGVLTASSTAAPTTQGAVLGWNRIGTGRTFFATQQGGGIGGFEWLNYDNSNALTSPNPLLTLDSAGALGAVNITTSGSLLSNTSVTGAQTLIARGYVAPFAQGAHVGWNRAGGSGRTFFGNQRGSGLGGFEWINFDTTNTITSPDPAMLLDVSGNLTVGGAVSSTGVVTGSAVFYQAYFTAGVTQSINMTNNVNYDIAFPNTKLTSQNVDAASGSGFTVTIPGTYMFNLTLTSNIGSSTTAMFYININGLYYEEKAFFISAGRLSGSLLTPLAVNDVITWKVIKTDGTSPTLVTFGNYTGAHGINVTRLN